MKTFQLFMVLSILLWGGIASAEEKRFTIPLGDSPATGPENAPITLVEFLDFQ
jgi:hypothetical protein